MSDGSGTSTAAPKRRLALTQLAPTMAERVARVRAELAELDRDATRARFALGPDERLLKSTVGLCPECLAHAPAAVFARGRQVWIRKACPAHGASDAVLENDERFYFLSNKDARRFEDARVFEIPKFVSAASACCADGQPCGDATDQASNKTCTILVEVTNACNLACPVCYSDAKGDRKLPLAAFKEYLTRLVERKGGLDSVQLTGGEALLHPELWEMIAFLYAERRIGKIYLPTNGILLAREDIVRRLAPYRDRLMVLLQFDGSSDATDRALRAATPAKVRARAVELLDRAEIPVQLTMTLVRGVNDREIGDVVRAGLRHPNVKVIALQPATYSGRFERPRDAVERLTLSDVAQAVVAQAGLRMRPEDFVPIPCSHPNCGWITLFVRRFGIVQNVVRYVDLPRVVERIAYRTLLSTTELRDTVGTARGSIVRRAVGALARRVVRSTDVFTIAIKPFMDKHTYDQDRIANCCHHLMDTRGQAISFCEYNALQRPRDSWERFPLLS
jgi:uncharacterized radical SAM superfamily Fe-S cluster-containing enzyme